MNESNIREDSKEAILEGLKKSKAIVNQLFPVLVEKGTATILDGRTRKASDPNWVEREIEITDPKQRVLITLHANYRRAVKKEETKTQVLQLIEMLENEGVPKEEILSRLDELLPFTPRYIRSLVPAKYKRAKYANKNEPIIRTVTATINEKEFENSVGIEMPNGERIEIPEQFIQNEDEVCTCPHCRTKISVVTCPRCMSDIPVKNIKGENKDA